MMIKLIPVNEEVIFRLVSWIESPEILMQFAGPSLVFPLTMAQLHESLKDPNRIAFGVIDTEEYSIIGYAEIYTMKNFTKLSRIILGQEDKRGQGLGKQIVTSLLEHSFNKLQKEIVELNVFDWNSQAIRCYEKVGFTINPDKVLERNINNQTWFAINMSIDRNKWMHLNKSGNQ